MNKKQSTLIRETLGFITPKKSLYKGIRKQMINHLEHSNIDYNELVLTEYIKQYGDNLEKFYIITKENPNLPFTYSFRKYLMVDKKTG